MAESERSQRRLIRTIAREVAYEILYEHLDEYEHKRKKTDETHGKAKVCPLAAAHPQQQNSDCLGEACACYVKIDKPLQVQVDQSKLADPKYFCHYACCGLITQIPWELVRSEEKLSNAGQARAKDQQISSKVEENV